MINEVIASGELRGKQTDWDGGPKVRSYQGELPPGIQGFTFYTTVMPTTNAVDGRADWLPDDPGVATVEEDGETWASIPVEVAFVRYEDGREVRR